MMRRYKLLAAALALVLLVGCTAAITQRPRYVNPIDFYYCRQDAVYGSETGALAYETTELGRRDMTVEEILTLYFKGPLSDALRSPFPQGLACTHAELDGGVLTLHLNEAYGTLSGVELSLAAACLTMTLTQIAFVDSVRVQTPSALLTAQAGQTFTPEQFVLFDASAYNPERSIVLYFCGRSDGLLRKELRTVSYTSTDQLPTLALRALLDGPQEYGLLSTVPRHTQLIDLSVSDGVCLLVLSEAFSECDTDATSAVRALRPVVATLCAFDEIDAVQISLVDGSSMTYLDLGQSFSSEDSWFASEQY